MIGIPPTKYFPMRSQEISSTIKISTTMSFPMRSQAMAISNSSKSTESCLKLILIQRSTFDAPRIHNDGTYESNNRQA